MPIFWKKKYNYEFFCLKRGEVFENQNLFQKRELPFCYQWLQQKAVEQKICCLWKELRFFQPTDNKREKFLLHAYCKFNAYLLRKSTLWQKINFHFIVKT